MLEDAFEPVREDQRITPASFCRFGCPRRISSQPSAILMAWRIMLDPAVSIHAAAISEPEVLYGFTLDSASQSTRFAFPVTNAPEFRRVRRSTTKPALTCCWKPAITSRARISGR
jgi:hypothetical protein